MISIRTLFASLGASLLLASVAQAQAPANDQCSNARALTSAVSVTGTTANAADDLIGLPGCQNAAASVHPDVWYTIRATAPQLDFVVTAAPGAPNAPFELLVYEGACAAGLTLLSYECGNGTVRGGVGALTVGTTYRIVVASPDSASATAFTIQATISTPALLASQDCNQATNVISPATFSQGTSNAGSGIVPNEVTTTNSCFGAGTGNTAERQSKWFRFVAGTTGPLQFNINPIDPGDDYDWAVWNITGDPAGCTTKGNAIACNWTGQRGATGLSLCPSQEPGYTGGDQFDNKTTMQTGANAPITVQAGNVYALLVDNYLATNSGFTLLLGGACPTMPGPSGLLAAQIGLDAEFLFFPDCNTVVFTKKNTLVSTAGFRYLWNFGDGTSSTNPTPIHTFAGSPNAPTTYAVTLQITNPLVIGSIPIRTTFSLPVTISRVVVATVVASVPNPICAGDSITLHARGGTTYAWSPATGLSSTTDSVVRAAPTVSTTYSVIATDGSCADTTTFRVVVTPLPTTQATAALSNLCLGASTTLTATGATRYEWSPATGLSATTGASVVATPTTTTTYTVTGFNGQCAVPDTVTITVVPTVPASGTIAGNGGISPYSTSFAATVADATAWLWDFGDGQTSTLANPTHTYAAPGTYTVTLTATYGVARCQTPVTEIGKVEVAAPIVYNIITPNGDGKNDVFSAPVSNGPVKLRVFNRWGREVYVADNYQQNWKGDDLPAGTYYYHLSATDGKSWKGWLELVR